MSLAQSVKDFIASIDTDSSGTVDAHELIKAFEGSGIEEKYIREFIKQYDKNGDGKLDVKELTNFIKSCNL